MQLKCQHHLTSSKCAQKKFHNLVLRVIFASGKCIWEFPGLIVDEACNHMAFFQNGPMTSDFMHMLCPASTQLPSLNDRGIYHNIMAFFLNGPMISDFMHMLCSASTQLLSIWGIDGMGWSIALLFSSSEGKISLLSTHLAVISMIDTSQYTFMHKGIWFI